MGAKWYVIQIIILLSEKKCTADIVNGISAHVHQHILTSIFKEKKEKKEKVT